MRVTTEEKPCSSCNRVGVLLSANHHSRQCSECIRIYQREWAAKQDPLRNFKKHIKSSYGLTFEQWSQMLIDVQGRCAGCLHPMYKPNVDHCHVTGMVRGMLCNNCNQSLGYAQDDINVLINLTKYLRNK